MLKAGLTGECLECRPEFWYAVLRERGTEAVRMHTSLDEIVADAMKLPLRDRVRLAQRLVSSLDDQMEADVEALWAAEAERRLEELRTGKVKGIEAAEAFRKAHEALGR